MLVESLGVLLEELLLLQRSLLGHEQPLVQLLLLVVFQLKLGVQLDVLWLALHAGCLDIRSRRRLKSRLLLDQLPHVNLSRRLQWTEPLFLRLL